METQMQHQHDRSMLPQPKTGWKCECGSDVFKLLMCPECKGEESHLIGFECVACSVIHVTPAGGTFWEENENELH